MKNVIILLLLFLMSLNVSSQEEIECVMKIADEQEYRQLNEMFHQKTLAKDFPDEDVLKIPVVVHVLHKGEPVGEGSNISDEQVISAIEDASYKFRNGHGLSEDIGIEFCLAQVDPDGNPTNGITRFNGCISTTFCNEGVSAGNGQGLSEVIFKNWVRWPNQQYYNIWIVPEIENNNGGGGIQAYAYFPTTSYVDGIVQLYNATGTVGNRKSYTDENETLVHELGHTFALFHTFQSTFNCNGESNCLIQGDRVCDTPPTPINSYCNWPACSGVQQVENYMDYTSEVCKDLFTAGQRDRMRLAAMNSRPNLIASGDSLCADPLPELDVSDLADVQCPDLPETLFAETAFEVIHDYNVDFYYVEVDTNYTGSPFVADYTMNILPEEPFDSTTYHYIQLPLSNKYQAVILYTVIEGDTLQIDGKKFFCPPPVNGNLECGWTLSNGVYYPADNTVYFAVYLVTMLGTYEQILEGSPEDLENGFTLPELNPGEYYFFKTDIGSDECHFIGGIITN